MLNSHPNSSGPSLGNSASRSWSIDFQNCQSYSVIQDSSVVVSLTVTERSWVQFLVLALFPIEDGVQVKAEINKAKLRKTSLLSTCVSTSKRGYMKKIR